MGARLASPSIPWIGASPCRSAVYGGCKSLGGWCPRSPRTYRRVASAGSRRPGDRRICTSGRISPPALQVVDARGGLCALELRGSARRPRRGRLVARVSRGRLRGCAPVLGGFEDRFWRAEGLPEDRGGREAAHRPASHPRESPRDACPLARRSPLGDTIHHAPLRPRTSSISGDGKRRRYCERAGVVGDEFGAGRVGGRVGSPLARHAVPCGVARAAAHVSLPIWSSHRALGVVRRCARPDRFPSALRSRGTSFVTE